jgi:cephalosporin hydroxylase
VITIDGDVLVLREDGAETRMSIGSPEAFALLSQLWLRAGWDTKYVYSFTWLGRPIIQLPEDLIRLQEVIYTVAPTVIIETGVAHGGSLVFYAGLCKAMGKGRVVGVDIHIRPANRAAIESHLLADYITLIEGDSVAPDTIARVGNLIQPDDRVMVLLDSCHTKDHVLKELDAYAPLVSPGSYIVAMDGIMEQVAGAPRTEPDWTWNNPRQAALAFAANNPQFVLEEPPFLFNEGSVRERITYWPGAWLRRA